MGPGPRHLKRSIEQLQLIEAGSASVKTLKIQHFTETNCCCQGKEVT